MHRAGKSSAKSGQRLEQPDPSEDALGVIRVQAHALPLALGQAPWLSHIPLGSEVRPRSWRAHRGGLLRLLSALPERRVSPLTADDPE